MTIKHKVIQDFQFISSDKKIFVLKSGIILEDYKYKVKNESIDIDRDIIDNNPEFFSIIDWKSELLTYMKSNKIAQPSQIAKKIVPFIEDMILSSIQQSSGQVMDESMVIELDRRDKRLKDKEEEIEIRLKRIEKREESYKEDLKLLDKKEDDIRSRIKELNDKQSDVEDKLRDINDRERNLDRTILESSKDIDSKYVELQAKIDIDLKKLSEREKDIESKIKEISNKGSILSEKESEIEDRVRNHDIRVEELDNLHSDIKRLDDEIKEWEATHWKMRRTPPSAII